MNSQKVNLGDSPNMPMLIYNIKKKKKRERKEKKKSSLLTPIA
jgi:hypothetical protein